MSLPILVLDIKPLTATSLFWTALTRVTAQLNALSARLVLGCSAEHAYARWDKALNIGGDAVMPNTKGCLVIYADVRERKRPGIEAGSEI
jgi:hypothetical protein